MATDALEARFEQMALSDQNQDPQHSTSYHKSKVRPTYKLKTSFADDPRAHYLPQFL